MDQIHYRSDERLSPLEYIAFLRTSNLGSMYPRMEAAGGDEDITVTSWANRKAMPLYAACGMTPQEGLIGKEATGWDLFDVRDGAGAE
ncbi:MAG: hypothetical protein GY715_07800 [Planctomycetes bacterium]|nr:hypothetical protein [Planctomycetota bacterium]